MRNTVLRPFLPGDYLRLTEGQPDWTWAGPRHREQAARLYYERGPAWTLWATGDAAVPIVCAGIVILWPGLGEAWLVAGPRAAAYRRVMLRDLLWGLREAAAAHGLRRVQADAVAAFTAGRRLLMSLGFVPESVMRQYGPSGEDFLRTVWFPGAPQIARVRARKGEILVSSRVEGGEDRG